MASISARTAVSVFSILVGLFMIIFWAALVATNQILPEQIPYAISFHLAGEFATALLLIASGAGLWKHKGWAKILAPFALGMLLYTVIVSPGYYAQLGNYPMVIMFSILTIATVAALAGAFKELN